MSTSIRPSPYAASLPHSHPNFVYSSCTSHHGFSFALYIYFSFHDKSFPFRLLHLFVVIAPSRTKTGTKTPPVNQWTIEKEGRKQIDVTGLGDKPEITPVLAVCTYNFSRGNTWAGWTTCSGKLLQVQCIQYKLLTDYSANTYVCACKVVSMCKHYGGVQIFAGGGGGGLRG